MAISTPLNPILGTAILSNTLTTTPQNFIAAYTVSAGSNLALYCLTFARDGQGEYVTNPTSDLDGVFTQIGTAVADVQTTITFWRLDSPTVGDHAISAQGTGIIFSANLLCYYTTGDGLSAADYSTDNAATGSVVEADVTTPSTGNLIVGGVLFRGQSAAPSSGETLASSGQAFGDHYYGLSYFESSAVETVTIDFTAAATPTEEAMFAVALAPAAAGGGAAVGSGLLSGLKLGRAQLVA